MALVRDRPGWVEQLCARVDGEVAHLGCADSGAGYCGVEVLTCFPPSSGRVGRAAVNPLLSGAHRLFHGPVGDGLIALASRASSGG